MTRRFEAEQFAIVPVNVLDADISDGAVRLYAVLRRYANGEGEAWPSMATLATRLRCDKATVRRRLKELTDAGFVVIEHRFENRRQRSNIYRFPPTTASAVIHRGGTGAPPVGWHTRTGGGGRSATLNENHVNEIKGSPSKAVDNPAPGRFLPGTGSLDPEPLSPAARAALEQLDRTRPA